MTATLHVLRPQNPSLSGFLRVGHTGHRKLADLHAAGRLPFRRVVFDAGHFAEQAELAKTLKAIFDAKGGRSRFGCNDTKCCPHGGEDMIESAHAHFITQRHRQIDDLSSVPEARRAEHFLLRHLDPGVRSARHATRLKIEDEKVQTAVAEAKIRMVRLRDALADLQVQAPEETRSRSPQFRGGSKAVSAVLVQ